MVMVETDVVKCPHCGSRVSVATNWVVLGNLEDPFDILQCPNYRCKKEFSIPLNIGKGFGGAQ